MRRIIDERYARAVMMLRDERGRLDSIVGRLLVSETLDEPEIYAAAGIDRPALPSAPATAALAPPAAAVGSIRTQAR